MSKLIQESHLQFMSREMTCATHMAFSVSKILLQSYFARNPCRSESFSMQVRFFLVEEDQLAKMRKDFQTGELSIKIEESSFSMRSGILAPKFFHNSKIKNWSLLTRRNWALLGGLSTCRISYLQTSYKLSNPHLILYCNNRHCSKCSCHACWKVTPTK